jgi:hypothetical protein
MNMLNQPMTQEFADEFNKKFPIVLMDTINRQRDIILNAPVADVPDDLLALGVRPDFNGMTKDRRDALKDEVFKRAGALGLLGK